MNGYDAERSDFFLAGFVGTVSSPRKETASTFHPKQLLSCFIVVPLANQFLKGNYRQDNLTRDLSFDTACSYVGWVRSRIQKQKCYLGKDFEVSPTLARLET